LFLYRNFPEITSPEVIGHKTSSGNIKMVYAGLLGVAQGIHKLCKKLDYNTIEFHIYGSGAEEQLIKNLINSNKELPIFFHGKVNRDELHQKLANYDLTIIPLLNRIYGSVPSKIFEYAKLGLPMLYFGGGEGEEIIERFSLGWFAKEGDYDHLNKVLKSIKIEELNPDLKKSIQKTALVEFNFKKQLELLKKVI